MVQEFKGNWEELTYKADMIEKQLKRMKAYDDAINDLSMPIGADAERAVKQRVNQKFFREAVLSKNPERRTVLLWFPDTGNREAV